MLCPMKTPRAFAIVLSALLAPACAPGGADVTTDLFLFDLWADSGLVRVGEPQNLTERQGYDNQPSWSEDGNSIFYASRTGESSDVYRFDLQENEAVRVTRTEDREYSPRQMPGGNGVTAVRFERTNSLRVWRFDADGQNPVPLLPAFREAVRYYEWIDDDTVALGVDDGVSGLSIAHIGSGEVEPVVQGIGRSLNRVPGKRAVSFVLKETPAEWWIAELDLDTRMISQLARTLQGVEDHAWTPSGKLLMGTGTRLYMFVPGQSKDWEEIADFSASDIKAISRIAVSPDGDKAVVAAEVSGP